MPISSDQNPKFLGVTLDPALRLHKHTDIIHDRAHKRLHMIKSVKGKNWGASSQHSLMNDIYKRHQVQSIKYRAIKLTDRYICKAYHLNAIVRELVDE